MQPQLAKILEVFLLALLWSPCYLLIKFAVAEMAPLWVVFFRLLFASVIFLVILPAFGQKLQKGWDIWRKYIVFSILASALPFSCFAFAGRHIDTALSAIINGTTPIFVVALAHYFLPGEQLTTRRFIGIFLGLFGFLLILVPTLLDREIGADTWGILAVGLAALSYALSMVYARKSFTHKASLSDPASQMLVSCVVMFIIASITTPVPVFSEISTKTWLSILGLSVSGTVLASLVYFRIVRRYGATILSMATFLLPPLGSIWGFLILGESFSVATLMGGALILSGMRFVSSGSRVK